MLQIKASLLEKLKARQVTVEVPDANTVLLRNVPTQPHAFSRPTTHLLLKRPRQGLPFLALVDADLKYVGDDRTVAQVFDRSMDREGWKALPLTAPGQTALQPVVESALGLLGFDGSAGAGGRSPSQAPAREADSLLARFGANLTERVIAGTVEPTLGRDEAIDEVLACLGRWGQARLPLIAAESGVGKTNLLHGVAARLHGRRPCDRLILVDAARLLAGTLFDCQREEMLAGLLDEAGQAPGVVLAIDRFEVVLREAGRAPLLLLEPLDRGLRLAATLPRGDLERCPEPLARRAHVVPLAELSAVETARVLAAMRDRLAAHHGVDIDPTCIDTAVRAAGPLSGAFPAKAIALLDAAASRAALAGAAVVGSDDVYFAASRMEGVV